MVFMAIAARSKSSVQELWSIAILGTTVSSGLKVALFIDKSLLHVL
jgi:hypothetical protein